MAVGLAHEVRNPLGAIRGAVQLLKRELGTDSRWSEYTDVLLTEVDRVNRIIEMLLDLAGPVQLRLVPLNLHQLLERVATLHEEACRERKVGLVRSYDPSLPPILGDEDRLVQVFHNLLRNAFDAMPSGGRLTLTTRVSLNPLFGKMDLGAGQRNMVEAKVADEGGGIPAAARARIFDPFFTTKDKGLVLGLVICHRMLEEHRGGIQVDSAEGRGTVVTCFLPIAKMTPSTQESCSPTTKTACAGSSRRGSGRRGTRSRRSRTAPARSRPSRPNRSTSSSSTCGCRAWTASPSSRGSASYAPTPPWS